MIIFISSGLAIILLICLIGLGYGIMQNIGTILLLLLFGCVFLCFVFRWPIETLFGTLILCAVILGLSHCNNVNEANSTPVTIYIATEACYFADEEGREIKIAEGAIVAKYRHPSQESTEPQYSGHSEYCSWYIDGQVYSSTVSIRRDSADLAKMFGLTKNQWHLEPISEITYREFCNEAWWELS